ncbi:MAG: SGNH/GDSL hydrolase family protein, partial [Alphaproteobacteria bacterium]|nr:SGNH/GDSL hydrolase family protein [Alphaproteobacteria bacterium]
MATWNRSLFTLAAIFSIMAWGSALLFAPALAVEPITGVSPHCRVPDGMIDTSQPLPLTTARLAAGQPLVIVAVGSSSTAGAGASHPGASYPARLREELAKRFPGAPITILNRGIGGETSQQMIERFEKDVL